MNMPRNITIFNKQTNEPVLDNRMDASAIKDLHCNLCLKLLSKFHNPLDKCSKPYRKSLNKRPGRLQYFKFSRRQGALIRRGHLIFNFSQIVA